MDSAHSSGPSAPGQPIEGVQQSRREPDSQPDAPASQVLGRSPGRLTGVRGDFLLNFHSYNSSNKGAGGSARNPLPPRRGGPRPQPYDVSRFLQANFRFLVAELDARRYEADADLMLDWEDVVLVRPAALEVEMLSTNTEVVCPITLDKLLCPQITPCGHIFSAASIMQHMVVHGGPELRKAVACPICFTKIAARELRLASIKQVCSLEPGQTVRFQLLQRPRGTIVPVEVKDSAAGDVGSGSSTAAGLSGLAISGQPERRGAQQGPWDARQGGGDAAADAGEDSIRCSRFAKFTTIEDPTPLWVAAGRTLAAHAAQITAEGGLDAAYEAPYVFAAMDSLAARARTWVERRQRRLLERSPSELAGMQSPEDAGQAAYAAVRKATTAAISTAVLAKETAAANAALARDFPALGPSTPPVGDSMGEPAVQPGAATDPAAAPDADLGWSGAAGPVGQEQEPAASASSGGHDAAAVDPYYFYQVADGQWGFLSPINLRMLQQHYGAYAALPREISAKLLEAEAVVQTEATRKRLKVFGHLPLTSQFLVCEVDLEGILPPEAIAPFSEELAQRRRKRAQRAKRDAQQLRREEAAALSAKAAAETGLSAAELRAMPLPGAVLAEDALAEFFAGEEEEEGPAAALQVESQPQEGVSFARMAALGFAATGPSLSEAAGGERSGSRPAAAAYPSLGSASPPRAPLGAWGSKPASAARPPGVQQSQQLIPDPPAAGSSKPSKGKKGGTLLFSTSSRRY